MGMEAPNDQIHRHLQVVLMSNVISASVRSKRKRKKAFQKTRSSDWMVTMRANSGLVVFAMILIMCGASAASSDNDELLAPFDTSSGLRTL